MIDLPELTQAIRKAWCRETSHFPDCWTPENPAWGQCAVTAVVVQDYLCGNIVRALAILPDKRKVQHYFNRIYSEDIDLTREQLPAGTRMKVQQVEVRMRDGLLFYEDTVKRYNLLRQRVDVNLREMGF